MLDRFTAARPGVAYLATAQPREPTILDQLGEEHQRTGSLIVYTSADSVFQIAAHEDVVPLPELYRACDQWRVYCVMSTSTSAA